MLNWRWKSAKVDEYMKEIILYNGDTIFLSKYSCPNSFNTFIAQKLEDIDDAECIVLTHFSDHSHSSINIDPNSIKKPDSFQRGFFVHQFGGGEGGKVYYGDSNYDGLLETENDEENTDPKCTIKEENFEKVWDYYRNTLTLEYQKKKIVETFLPLAIDQKGLSECSLTEGLNNYFNDVKTDLEGNAKKIIDDWKEIKKVLANLQVDKKKAVSETEKSDEKDDEKALMYFPLETKDNPEFTEENLINFVTSNGENGMVKSIEAWLNEAVGVLDKKINSREKE